MGEDRGGMFLFVSLFVCGVFGEMYTVIFTSLPTDASLSTIDRMREEKMRMVRTLLGDGDKIDTETVTGFIGDLTEETWKRLSGEPGDKLIKMTTQPYINNKFREDYIEMKKRGGKAGGGRYATQRQGHTIYPGGVREELHPEIGWKKFSRRMMYMQRNAQWGLRYICDPSDPPPGYLYTNDGGTNVIVYVIDSGVDVSHKDFEGRAHWGADFTGKKVRRSYGRWVYDETGRADGVSYNTRPFADEDGHGTIVASIIGGKKSGIAKNAAIIGVRVFDKDGKPPEDAVVKGVNYVWRDYVGRLREFYERTPGSRRLGAEEYTARKLGEIIRMDGAPQAVVNMSLGGVGQDEAAESMIEAAASHAGMHFSIAAGNDGVNAAGFTPARSLTGVGVGAYGTNLARASFSNYGLEEYVELYAPGEGMNGAETGTQRTRRSVDGTSFAAPIVAGVMALYLTHEKLRPAELRARLMREAVKNPNGVLVRESSYGTQERTEYGAQGKRNSKMTYYPRWGVRRYPMNMCTLKPWLDRRMAEMGM